MINIGNRRECFFDDYLIDNEKTSAETRLHKPARQGVLLDFDKQESSISYEPYNGEPV